jgi:hypothetical protein
VPPSTNNYGLKETENGKRGRKEWRGLTKRGRRGEGKRRERKRKGEEEEGRGRGRERGERNLQ